MSQSPSGDEKGGQRAGKDLVTLPWPLACHSTTQEHCQWSQGVGQKPPPGISSVPHPLPPITPVTGLQQRKE